MFNNLILAFGIPTPGDLSNLLDKLRRVIKFYVQLCWVPDRYKNCHAFKPHYTFYKYFANCVIIPASFVNPN